jgi:hypothetical protein
VPRDSYWTYFKFHHIPLEGEDEFVGMWYADHPQGGLFYSPCIVSRGDVQVGDVRPGRYPDMRYHANLFPLETQEGINLIYGLSPFGEVLRTDIDLNPLYSFSYGSRFVLDKSHWEHPLCRYKTAIPINEDRLDVLVFDVDDLDEDGQSEVLAAFGPLHNFIYYPADNPVQETVLRVLTHDLKPWNPELGLDRIEVEGAAMGGAFRDMDGDGNKEIVVIADEIVLLSP